MELWFGLALAAVFFGGILSFTHKVAAIKNYNVPVLSVYASLVSATVFLCCTTYFAGFGGLLGLSTVVAILAAITFLITIILKIESLKLIDTAIFFPINKVSGPLITIFLGILFFSESFTSIEWLGLILSLCVPLLLITKEENSRQKNLLKGLRLLLIGSAIGAVSIALFKYGSDITTNVWLYLLVSEIFTIAAAFVLILRRHKTSAFLEFKTQSSIGALKLSIVMGLAQCLGIMTLVFSFVAGGPLGIVYTIYSLNILIPIVLSAIIYKEHWSVRKAIAIILSIFAIMLLR